MPRRVFTRTSWGFRALGKASLPSRPRRDEGPISKGAIHWRDPGRRCQKSEAESAPISLGCSDASYGTGIVLTSLLPKGISCSRHLMWCSRRGFNWWAWSREIPAGWCTCKSKRTAHSSGTLPKLQASTVLGLWEKGPPETRLLEGWKK